MKYLHSSHNYVRHLGRRTALAILCGAALLLAAPSCEKAPAPSPQPAEPASAIGFASATSATKAIIAGENTIEKDAKGEDRGFGVVGYLKQGGSWVNLFDPNNEKVYRVGDGLSESWTYDNTKFWEATDYRFFAYYPYDASATLDVSKCKESNESNIAFGVTYIVPNSWATSYEVEQVDFMLAAPALETSSISRTDPVTLNFKHALCQVGFRVNKSGEGILQIVDIQLVGFNSKGKATINNASGTVSWGSQSTSLVYSYKQGVQGLGAIPASPDYATVPNMLLIPQGFNNASNWLRITVKDTADNKEWTLAAHLNQTDLVNKWEAGKRYIYTLTVNTNPTIVDLALQIKEWTDVKINVTI